MLSLLALASFVGVPSDQTVHEEVLDPKIVHAAVFRPGLAMLTREAMVPAGSHLYRLRTVPEALDDSLWFSSSDGASISDILTHLRIKSTDSVAPSLSILDYLAANIGKKVSFDVRDGAPTPGTRHVVGTLLALHQVANSVVIKTANALAEYPIYTISKLDLAGLKPDQKTTKQFAAVDILFRVKADKPSHIQISSLEGGAAWNASYLVELRSKDTASVTARAQLAVGGLQLQNADIDLVAGMPDLSRTARLDLTTGLTSLNDWLDQHSNSTVPLDKEEVDPYLKLARLLSANSISSPNSYQFGGNWGMGGGLGGGGGMATSQLASRDSNAIEVESDRVRFINRAIQAARLEDTFVYPFGHIDLEPGERLTRNLSKIDAPINTHYVWSVNLLPGGDSTGPVRRILSIKNNSDAPWPGGTIFLSRDQIPMAEVEMPLTLPGSFADVPIGKADDISKDFKLVELSRSPLGDNWRYTTRVEYEATLTIQNTRLEILSTDIEFDALGEVHSSEGGTVTKSGTSATWENPGSKVTWHFDFEPNEKKVLHVRYAVNI